jgi:hypothetical protein
MEMVSTLSRRYQLVYHTLKEPNASAVANTRKSGMIGQDGNVIGLSIIPFPYFEGIKSSVIFSYLPISVFL